MQKTILVSLVTIGLLASVIGVGTYAFFSDTEVSTGNTMTAGILNLEFGEPLVMPFTISDMKPSYKKESPVITLKFENNPGKLYKMITQLDCNQGVQTEPETEEENILKDVGCPNATSTYGKCDLFNYVWFDLKVNGVEVIPDKTVLLGPGPEWMNNPTELMPGLLGKWIYLGLYTPNATGWANMNFQQSFHMVSDTTNWAQGDTCTFTEQFLLLQDNDLTYEDCDVVGEVCEAVD